MLANGFYNLLDGQILLHLLTVASVVTCPGTIQTQEPSEAVRTQFALQDLKSVSFELLVRQMIDGSLIQDSGFRTGIRRLPAFRAARLNSR